VTRTTVAVVLEVVFAVLAIGVRSWIQWRRTGSMGFVLPRRAAPAVERHAGAGFLAAQFTMGDSWRIGVDAEARTALVTTGIFRTVRNPIFSAMILAVAGFVLLVPNVYALAALAVLLLGLELQVRGVEEPYLRAVHGEMYRAYATRAGRFLPGLGRERPAT
jgi:protein-S-isoprenylcysteine O-methyltransferase Ste14